MVSCSDTSKCPWYGNTRCIILRHLPIGLVVFSLRCCRGCQSLARKMSLPFSSHRRTWPVRNTRGHGCRRKVSDISRTRMTMDYADTANTATVMMWVPFSWKPLLFMTKANCYIQYLNTIEMGSSKIWPYLAIFAAFVVTNYVMVYLLVYLRSVMKPFWRRWFCFSDCWFLFGFCFILDVISMYLMIASLWRSWGRLMAPTDRV